MKWSVALFGHEKPHYYVQEPHPVHGWVNNSIWVDHPGEPPAGMRVVDCTGWEKRAAPGDLIDCKPEFCWTCDEQQHREIVGLIKDPHYLARFKEEMCAAYVASCLHETGWRPAARFERIWQERLIVTGLHDPQLLPAELKQYYSFLPGASLWHHKGETVWGVRERQTHLIVGLDGPEPEHWQGLKEPYWDKDSYTAYNPMKKNDFEKMVKAKYAKSVVDRINFDESYQEHLNAALEAGRFPSKHLKKRRYQVPLDILRDAGVDLERMLDPNLAYIPGVEVKHLDGWDKLNSRKIAAADKLQPIKPRTNAEITNGLL